jgi:hypothetical protein
MNAEQYLKRIENKRLNSTPLYSRKEMIDFAEKYAKQLTLTDVVSTLPSVKSKEFKRWTQSKGYEPAFNGLWYEKNNQTYSTDLLYRAFTNEIEFGN